MSGARRRQHRGPAARLLRRAARQRARAQPRARCAVSDEEVADLRHDGVCIAFVRCSRRSTRLIDADARLAASVVSDGCIKSPETRFNAWSNRAGSRPTFAFNSPRPPTPSNRAVMADTDEASVAFAREAEQATQAVEKDAAALAPILQRSRLLERDPAARGIQQPVRRVSRAGPHASSNWRSRTPT